MKKDVAVVIPARLSSTRFPRKVLADIHGKPLIQHVYRGCHSDMVSEVFVATEDDELVDIVEGFGGIAINTGPARTVLDRCSMAASHDILGQYKTIVVVQGDEPMVNPSMVELAVNALLDRNHDVTCCFKELDSDENPSNVNIIKTVLKNRDWEFGWFSRSPIPVPSPEKDYANNIQLYLKQVCIMAFRAATLVGFRYLPMRAVEATEGIDLLRYLENGKDIGAVYSSHKTHAVDVPDDLELVRRLIKP